MKVGIYVIYTLEHPLAGTVPMVLDIDVVDHVDLPGAYGYREPSQHHADWVAPDEGRDLHQLRIRDDRHTSISWGEALRSARPEIYVGSIRTEHGQFAIAFNGCQGARANSTKSDICCNHNNAVNHVELSGSSLTGQTEFGHLRDRRPQVLH